ncbi:MAG: acyl--CoA ligase [Clostridia bacterium]|nr:acyl--CoA ligase [Clostridia bacterium]
MKTNREIFEKYADSATLDRIVKFNNLGAMWDSRSKEYASLVAVSQSDASLTFAQLDASVSKLRAALKEAGVKKGDNVGVLIPNGISFATAYLAVVTLGAVAVLLPPHLDEMTVFGCSMKFRLSALVYNASLEDKLSIIRAKNPALVLVEDTASSDALVPFEDVEPDAPCTVLFTGGTTGRSKGALLSHKAIMRGILNGCYGYPEVFNQRYFLVLPLTHVFGLVRNLLTSLYTGSAIHICRNNKDMFKEIAIFKPTEMIIVPALAEMALNLSKQFGKNMLGEDMKCIICGAATVAPYLVREYAKMGITLLPGYGLTESANLVSGNPEALLKPDSVGLIYEGTEYKIVDGELWLKGENMMLGYIGEEEETALSYHDGWFKTGDLVRMDEEGFLYITGRKKEIIVLASGENISPAELENTFNSLDCVQDSLVQEKDGALVIQILPRMTTLKALGVTDIEQYIKDQVAAVNATLPSFKRVGKVTVRTTDFVRSPSMKIVRDKN